MSIEPGYPNDINENCLVPLTLALKEAIREVFEARYRPGNRIAWMPFEQGWARELEAYRCPTKPTVRALLYKAHRRAFTYSVADGLCLLLLDRCYSESILRYPDLPEQGDSKNRLWHSDSEDLSGLPEIKIYENVSMLRLPDVMGREEAIETLLQWLANPHIHQIAITGLGGMGKTTLALAVAQHCLEVQQTTATSTGAASESTLPQFAAIIFASARQHYLEESTLGTALYRDRTLEDIVRTVAQTLDCSDLLKLPFNQQLPAMIAKLKEVPTLLILDDFESFEDPDTVLALLKDRVHGLPNTVKTLVTGRGHIPLQHELRLQPLTTTAASELIHSRADAKGIALSDADCLTLAEQGCNLPGVILYAVGLLATGASVEYVHATLQSVTGELAAYLFEKSIAPLRNQPAHKLLMALALFPQPALKAALEAVALASASPIAAAEGLATLQKLSLIERSQPPSEESSDTRYTMLPLTRQYVLAELQAYPEFAAQARDRWVKWYCDWTAAIVTESDWRRWNQSQALTQDWANVQAVIEWCVNHQHDEAFWAIWRNVRGYTHFAGYWNERLRWLKGFIGVARNRQGWQPQLAEALYDQGRTFVLHHAPEQLQQAKDLFEEAWQLCEQHHPSFQGEVSIDIAVIHLHQAQFTAAQEWLNRTEVWLDQADIEARIQSRLTAQVAYYRGEINLKTKQYDEAQQQYETAMEIAEEIGWQRAVVYSQVWLADLAMEQGDFPRAELLLEQSLPVLEAYQDQRCLALCRQSYAVLEQTRGNHERCRNWAVQALAGFRQLGMQQEIEAVEQLIKAC